MFDITILFKYTQPLLEGLWTTAWISFLSIFIGFFLGLYLYALGKSNNNAIKMLARIYISFFRGTPLLVQLVIVFYLLPLLHIDIPPIFAAIITLSMNTAAFQAEILRGGFSAIPKGQDESCWVLGLTGLQGFFYVKLPQVIKTTVPALINESIDIIKNSSLISTISVMDLMRIVQTYSSTTYRPLEFFVAAGLLYLVLTSIVNFFGAYIEKKLNVY
ncbi:MAG TPA: amino acid ABC transporter permease [Pasteurellaceae bacterium]|nr:amino acid ABC transporter permease [Pasteurellaceae bacterium]